VILRTEPAVEPAQRETGAFSCKLLHPCLTAPKEKDTG
jgi:hypothetical protein